MDCRGGTEDGLVPDSFPRSHLVLAVVEHTLLDSSISQSFVSLFIITVYPFYEFEAKVLGSLCLLFLLDLDFLSFSISFPEKLIPLEEILVLLFKLYKFLKSWNVLSGCKFVRVCVLKFIECISLYLLPVLLHFS